MTIYALRKLNWSTEHIIIFIITIHLSRTSLIGKVDDFKLVRSSLNLEANHLKNNLVGQLDKPLYLKYVLDNDHLSVPQSHLI